MILTKFTKANKFKHQFLKKNVNVSIYIGLIFYSLAPKTSFSDSNLALEKIAAGEVSLNSSQHNVTIKQLSDKAILDWHKFSIPEKNSVVFAQPNEHASILNRVTGTTASEIAGQLSGNGRIIITNPNGITITPSGVVNAHSFIASQYEIKNENFLNNRFYFEKNRIANEINHQGTINIDKDGFAALIGNTIQISENAKIHAKKLSDGDGPIFFKLVSDDLIGIVVSDQVDNPSSNKAPADNANGHYQIKDAKEAARKTINLITFDEINFKTENDKNQGFKSTRLSLPTYIASAKQGNFNKLEDDFIQTDKSKPDNAHNQAYIAQSTARSTAQSLSSSLSNHLPKILLGTLLFSKTKYFDQSKSSSLLLQLPIAVLSLSNFAHGQMNPSGNSNQFSSNAINIPFAIPPHSGITELDADELEISHSIPTHNQPIASSLLAVPLTHNQSSGFESGFETESDSDHLLPAHNQPSLLDTPLAYLDSQIEANLSNSSSHTASPNAPQTPQSLSQTPLLGNDTYPTTPIDNSTIPTIINFKKLSDNANSTFLMMPPPVLSTAPSAPPATPLAAPGAAAIENNTTLANNLSKVNALLLNANDINQSINHTQSTMTDSDAVSPEAVLSPLGNRLLKPLNEQLKSVSAKLNKPSDQLDTELINNPAAQTIDSPDIYQPTSEHDLAARIIHSEFNQALQGKSAPMSLFEYSRRKANNPNWANIENFLIPQPSPETNQAITNQAATNQSATPVSTVETIETINAAETSEITQTTGNNEQYVGTIDELRKLSLREQATPTEPTFKRKPQQKMDENL